MKAANIELAVEKLLKFMQKEMEQRGGNTAQSYFNFSPKFTKYFLNSEPEEIVEGKELTNLRDRSKLTDDVINRAIRVCLSRRYVKQRHYYPGLKNEHMGDETIILKLTESGYMTAMYLDVEVDEDVVGISDDTRYTAEKKKGGSNSYQKYRPLRDKVKELCKIEMQKEKRPQSALQLCLIVSKQIEENHLPLLCDFDPYQKVANDGGDWLRPTFYDWCNEIFKTSN